MCEAPAGSRRVNGTRAFSASPVLTLRHWQRGVNLPFRGLQGGMDPGLTPSVINPGAEETRESINSGDLWAHRVKRRREEDSQAAVPVALRVGA